MRGGRVSRPLAEAGQECGRGRDACAQVSLSSTRAAIINHNHQRTTTRAALRSQLGVARSAPILFIISINDHQASAAAAATLARERSRARFALALALALARARASRASRRPVLG